MLTLPAHIFFTSCFSNSLRLPELDEGGNIDIKPKLRVTAVLYFVKSVVSVFYFVLDSGKVKKDGSALFVIIIPFFFFS